MGSLAVCLPRLVLQALQFAHSIGAERVRELEAEDIECRSLASGHDSATLRVVRTMIAIQGQPSFDDHDRKCPAVERLESGRSFLGTLKNAPPLAVEEDASFRDERRVDRASGRKVDVLFVGGREPLGMVVLLRRLHVFAHEVRFGENAIAVRDVDEYSGATTMRAAARRVGVRGEARVEDVIAYLKVGDVRKVVTTKRESTHGRV